MDDFAWNRRKDEAALITRDKAHRYAHNVKKHHSAPTSRRTSIDEKSTAVEGPEEVSPYSTPREKPVRNTSDMLDVTFGMLNQLRHEVSPTSPGWQDWNMVAKCLHHYIFGLRQGGVDIPETYTELWSRQLWYQTIDKEDMECTERLSQPVCEPTEDYNLQTQLPPPPLSEEEIEADSYHDLPLNANDSLWAFMAGWYEIGPKIARNARDFCKVFTFLPWAALSML